nr:elongation of very long chain fatty acids 4 protein [Namalycastis rhodochorde]
MEAIQDTVIDLWEGYKWTWQFADTRVENWFLMDAYWKTWALVLLYLLVVWLGPKLMQQREAMKLRYPVVLYNAAMVIVNFHIFYELLVCSTIRGYSYSCQLVDYTDNPYEVRIAKALWWFYFSKCLEFMDTFFFILRKKNSQISFLHVYHHATMFPIWWVGVKWVPGGQAFFGAMMNSFIHVIMYTYYGLAALGPQFQKYLWWKRYLTRIQLVQFVLGMVHAAQSLLVGCPFPLWMQWALIFYGATILSLFLNFYFHAYIKPAKSRRDQRDTSNGHSANGHISNGTALSNGTAESRKTK